MDYIRDSFQISFKVNQKHFLYENCDPVVANLTFFKKKFEKVGHCVFCTTRIAAKKDAKLRCFAFFVAVSMKKLFTVEIHQKLSVTMVFLH